MPRLTILFALNVVLLSGCTKDEPKDASVDTVLDSIDADGSQCEQRQVVEFLFDSESDVDVRFLAKLDGGDDQVLNIIFQLVGDAEYTGTFDLAEEPPFGFSLGFCPHCFVVGQLRPDRGTLVQNEQPFDRRLDIQVSDLRLVEWDPETQAVVPDGRCVEVADFSVSEQFVPDRWTCDAAKFNDGTECHCSCGDFDPDCSPSIFCNPGSSDPECFAERDAVDCPMGSVCGSKPDPNFVLSTPMCVETCDFRDRQPCNDGVCVAKGMSPGECLEDRNRFDSAAVDTSCGQQGSIIKYCGVDAEGFALGICNDLFDDKLCAKICTADEDCTRPNESCLYFFSKEDGIGFCSKDPPDDG